MQVFKKTDAKLGSWLRFFLSFYWTWFLAVFQKNVHYFGKSLWIIFVIFLNMTIRSIQKKTFSEKSCFS